MIGRMNGEGPRADHRRPSHLSALLLLFGLAFFVPAPGTGHVLAASSPATTAAATPHADDPVAVLVGRVVEAGTRAPVQNASARLEGTRWDGVSNEHGRFVFEDVPAGEYLLVVEHLAYGTVREVIELDDAAATYDLEIVMSSEAIELDPISITVMRTGPLVDVYDRLDRMRLLGLGDIFDRRDIDRAGVSRVSHLIQTLPGARLQPIPGRVGVGELRLHARNNCPPSYYIDGLRTPIFGESVDDHVHLSAVEAVEVYRRLSTLPGEFADEQAQNCGAVAIWTRRGPPGHEPFGWRRLLVLVGFVSASWMMGSTVF